MSVAAEDRVTKFKADLEADLASVDSEVASLESEFDALKSNLYRLGQERDKLQRLIEDADRMLSSIRGNDKLPRAAEVVPQTAKYGPGRPPLQEDISTTNGLPEKASRRQMILQIVPEFQGNTFTAGDIRVKLIEYYLKDEPPNFPQAINNLLQRMATDGEIERVGRKGESRRDPWLYREKSQEESLNLGP